MKSLYAIVLMGLAQVATAQLNLSIQEQYVLDIVPSASGVVYYNNDIFAIGDDSPYLFEFNDKMQMVQQQSIKAFRMGDKNRILKRIKPDLEAFGLAECKGKTLGVILGSGSKLLTRENGFIRDMQTAEILEVNLSDLYAYLTQLAKIDDSNELNIEGIAFNDENVFLANRGNSAGNFIFMLDKDNFMNYLLEPTKFSLPAARLIKAKLPMLGQYEAGLSGLEYSRVQKALFYTAAVESTDDAYVSGALLGSFVGKISLEKLNQKNIDLTQDAALMMKDNRLLVTKAESLVILEDLADSVKVVIVSDTDDGSSEIYRATLSDL